LNIIFGTEEVLKVQDKYIVLELDTVTIKSSKPITVYCVIEDLSLEEITQAEIFKKLHADLMVNYKKRNWDFCLQALESLMGFWGKQVDSFYEIMRDRLLEYKENEPDTEWTGIIPKK
jgi:hypothetical protein